MNLASPKKPVIREKCEKDAQKSGEKVDLGINSQKPFRIKKAFFNGLAGI